MTPLADGPTVGNRATVLVTGSTGNVGSAVAASLVAAGVPIRVAVRPAAAQRRSLEGKDSPDHVGRAVIEEVCFDFTDPRTWRAAFDGVRSMFLVRPPALGNVRRDLLPSVQAARAAGVEHVVFLSLQGVERNKVVPHATVESWLRGSGLDWTFVRASFFHQNLSTTHAGDIRERDEICVPAGSGRTAFVDAVDVAAVAAVALRDRAEHAHRAWTLTGPRALSYDEVATILSAELGRPIRYTRPGLLRYARHARRELAMPWGMVGVTSAIYTTARIGLAAGTTADVRAVLGRDPIDFAEFAHRERSTWTPDPT